MAEDGFTFVDKPRAGPKIIKLGYYHQRPKILFDLPREVRDTIWTYVLAEPTLYNRRHKPGCAFYDPSASYQVPAALLHHADYHITRKPVHTGPHNLPKCRELCIRRRGFGLMKGVNKQIQREASEIFWESEKICFPESMMICVRPTLIAALKSIPQSALEHIRNLALWQVEDMSSRLAYSYHQEALPEVLQTFPNLTHLEISATLLELPVQDKIMSLPSLSTLRIYSLQAAQVTNGNDFIPVYIATGSQWKLPACRLKGNKDGQHPMSPSPHWCVACQDTSDEMSRVFKDLFWFRHHRRHWTAEVVGKLARIQPAQPDEAPYVIKSRMSGGNDNRQNVHKMYVWGLPIHPPATRAIETRRENRRENLANIVRRPPTLPVYSNPELDYDECVLVPAKKSVARRHQAIESKDRDHELQLEQRGNHLKNVAKAQVKTLKRQDEVNDKARKIAKEETRNERKAASKRSGRRMS